jgi:ABC-2 type transport system permease protein
MKTMKWLIRREFWEHKGMFFWAPIVVSLIMIALIGTAFLYGINSTGFQGSISVNGNETSLNTMVVNMTDDEKISWASLTAGGYMALSAPLFLMLGVVAFFYCLGALYEERRDRSILFWKSLPVSDQATVLSKIATALGLAPLIAIAAATVTSVVLLLVICSGLAFKGVNVFGMILSNPAVYLTPLQVLGLLPVYILWALPTIGWLLMVSAWARSKVFLWAVGTPVLAIVVLKWSDHLFNFSHGMAQVVDGRSVSVVDWFVQNIVFRGLAGLMPGAWFGFASTSPDQLRDSSGQGLDMGAIFTQSWITLSGPSVWIGAAVGIAMIFAAMRLRRWRDEG